MKVAVDRHFESNLGVLKTTNFAMKASPQAFKILSDSLYKNPILAVVRELVANAWDSHTAKGNTDKPFLIHAPTTLEPYFEITDYGVSMTDEFVHSRYITFFDSDKDHSNTAIGGFGLGSKAPFAYADQFTLICRLGGNARKYRLLVNEKSEYQIVDSGQSESDQPNGVTIRIPVAQKDFEAFREAVLDVIQYFPTFPQVNLPVEIPQPFAQVNIGVITAKLFDDKYQGGRAVMGYMPYEIDLDRLDGGNILRQCQIHAPIGYFDISPDREGLRFSDQTLERLKAVISEVREEFVRQFNQHINQHSSDFQKAQYAAYVISNGRDGNAQFHVARDVLTDLTKKMQPPAGVEVTHIAIPWRGNLVQFNKATPNEFDWCEHIVRIAREWNPRDIVKTFYRMEKKRPYQNFFRQMDASQLPVILFTGADDVIDAWIKECDLPEFERVPVLPKAPRLQRTKLTSKRRYDVFFNGDYDSLTADEISKRDFKAFIVPSASHNYREYSKVFMDHKLARVTIPHEHTRVREVLCEEYGATTGGTLKNLADAFKKSGGKVNKPLLAKFTTLALHRPTIVEISDRISNDKVNEFFSHADMKKRHRRLCEYRKPVLQLRFEIDTYGNLLDNRAINWLIDEECTTRQLSAAEASVERTLAKFNQQEAQLIKRYGPWIEDLVVSLIPALGSCRYQDGEYQISPLLRHTFRLGET